MQSREEYVRQAEDALARGRSTTQISKAETELRSAAVLVALAGLAEPTETADRQRGVADRITQETVADAIWGQPDRQAPGWVLEAAGRVVAMLLGRDA